jgi:hypothetical protein
MQEGITNSDEEFRLKYPDLDASYFGAIVAVETEMARGKNLYNRYYALKRDRNVRDDEVRRQAQETFFGVVEELMKIYRQTGAYSVMGMRNEASDCMQDLLREVEGSGATPQGGLPR